ncbi:MAG: hypothetical protein IIC73_05095 [Armatimonadetes bacterium]|nr:hypothetical protein [Armatimonadota bacterium]
MREKSFTMRMAEDTYAEVKRRAQKSVTQFVREAVAEKLERARDAEIEEGLLTLIEDDEDMSALQASQRKAIENAD